MGVGAEWSEERGRAGAGAERFQLTRVRLLARTEEPPTFRKLKLEQPADGGGAVTAVHLWGFSLVSGRDKFFTGF